jgi:aspartate racemase
LRLVEHDRPALVAYLTDSVRRLAAAGADFAAMTANTPHIVLDDVAARSPVPLVSIVEVCAREARRRGLRRLGLLGTRFTMEAPFYPAVCARHGLTVVTPGEADRAWIHARYVRELLRGEFREDTRRAFTSLVSRLRADHAIDGVVLGGTELPLLLPAPAIAGVPALDTTALHVDAIVERLRSGDRATGR